LVQILDQVELSLSVRCAGLDADGIAELADNLREELLLTEVDAVRPATAVAAAGAKAGEALTVGALVLTLVPLVAAGVVDVLASWLSRQPRDVEVEIDGQRYSGPVTRDERAKLIAAFLRRIDDGS
jgi:hypothetical protein